MQTSGFLRLPTDIIFKLIDLLEPQDTLQLAAVCRELAAIVSYIYYARTGLSNPQEKCTIKSDCRGYMDDLTGLSLDLQLTSIHHFVFHSSNSPAQVELLTRNVDRLCNIFGRLSSIGSVCIKLQMRGGSGWSMCSPSVQEFTIAFRRLLEIVLRKECTSLHIQHSQLITTNYEFELLQRKNIVLRSVRPIVDAVLPPEIQGKGWKFSKVYDIPIPLVPPPEMPSLRLTNVDLSCNFLLLPPFSLWTFGILKSSSVLSLTLSLPRNMEEDVFRYYIFPNLVESLPSLQQFKFTFHGTFALASVTENLPRFRHLQKLTLGHTYYGPFAFHPRNDLNTTCSLTSITGSLDQILYLLACLDFPVLKIINVLIEFRFRLEMHFVEIGSQFSTIYWILSELATKPRISVRLHHQGSLLSDISLQAMRLPNKGLTWIAHFRHVTQLYLEIAMSTQYAELSSYEEQVYYASQYALSWLDIFCGVTNLTLICREPFLDASSELLRNRWRTIIWSAIQEKHPKIRSFEVLHIAKNSLRHWTCDDEDWRSGDASVSEKDVECHFKPEIYSRSLKPDWVMHDVESEA